jgi:beta-N-acetylhexosaminidase
MPLVVIDLEGQSLSADERAALAAEPIAGVCLFARNLADREAARDLVADIRQAAGRELVISIDQEGGGVVRLRDVPSPPSAMALGAADDPALTEALGAVTARGLRAIGVNVDFAPVADVQNNPGNPVIGDRSFGADPERVARHVAAFVRGLQGAGVAATLKHFPGHGDVDVDSHLALPRLAADRERLEQVEWWPFRAGIEAGAAAVMTAHLLVEALDPQWPATLSRTTLEGVLRGSLGFDGVVFTDALDMRAVADRWSAPQAAVLALAAGADVPLSCGPLDEHLRVIREVERARGDGRLDAERIARAEARLARLLAIYPNGARGELPPAAADVRLVEEVARRAVVVLGPLPRLVPGLPVLLVSAVVTTTSASEKVARPTAALEEALEGAGVPVRRLVGGGSLREALAGVQALLVTTAAPTPLQDRDVEGARQALASAREAGVPGLHVALWNPANVARLPEPALVTFGFRSASAAAAVQVLLGGAPRGVAPVPLAASSQDDHA